MLLRHVVIPVFQKEMLREFGVSAETTVGYGQSWALNLQPLIPSPVRQGQQHISLAVLG